MESEILEARDNTARVPLNARDGCCQDSLTACVQGPADNRRRGVEWGDNPGQRRCMEPKRTSCYSLAPL